MHIVKHFLCARFPDFIVAGMSEQTYADNYATFQSQPLLGFNELLLKAGASAERNYLIVLYHFRKSLKSAFQCHQQVCHPVQ